MGLQPKIAKTNRFFKVCARCGETLSNEEFLPTKSPFYADGRICTCNGCIDAILSENGDSWDFIDKLCQMIDIPFIPNEWIKLREMNPDRVFVRYAEVVNANPYDTIEWQELECTYKKLRDEGGLSSVVDLINEQKRLQLQEYWGPNYDDEALMYLEQLKDGLFATQNVNGKLSADQAKKICKISYEIDRRIAGGEEFDKLLGSYDKLIKIADFTPKNTKNINDFDSVGELIKWLEKKGWKNGFYDGVSKDVVDETLQNIQSYNRRLYTNETDIGEEINKRIESLKHVAELEQDSYYIKNEDYDLDAYENEIYSDMEEFVPDLTVGGDDD